MRAQTRAHLGSFCLGFLACVVLLRGPALPSSRGGLGEEGRPAELPGWSGSPVGLAPSSDALGAKPAQDVSPTGSLSRQKVLAVIGVQTGFTTDPRPKYNYERRRAQLRAAWFPPNREAMDRWAGGAAFCSWQAAVAHRQPAACCAHTPMQHPLQGAPPAMRRQWLGPAGACCLQGKEVCCPRRRRHRFHHCCCRLEREQGMVVRFVVGHSADPEQEAALDREAAEHGGFWRLDVQVGGLLFVFASLFQRPLRPRREEH